MSTFPSTSRRYSVHSLTSDVIPDWLCEGTFSLEELGRPPSYLLSSIQEAFEGPSTPGPPAYDRVPPKDEPQAPVPSSVIEDDESMWTEDESTWGMEESGDNFVEFEGGVEGQDSDGGSTVLNVPVSQPQPTFASDYDPKLHTSLPPAYSQRHLDDDKTETFFVPHRLGTPDLALRFCLSSLEDELIDTPFSVFTDALYEAAVLGDPRPPSPPFALPPRAPSLHARSRSAGSQSCPPLAEEYEGSDEEDEVLISPVHTYTPPPLIWEAREQQNYLSRSASRNDLRASTPHLQQSLMFSKENLAGEQDSAAHVANLFLRAPTPLKAQDSISSFPTRPPQRPPTTSGVRALLFRSLNFSR